MAYFLCSTYVGDSCLGALSSHTHRKASELVFSGMYCDLCVILGDVYIVSDIGLPRTHAPRIYNLLCARSKVLIEKTTNTVKINSEARGKCDEMSPLTTDSLTLRCGNKSSNALKMKTHTFGEEILRVTKPTRCQEAPPSPQQPFLGPHSQTQRHLSYFKKTRCYTVF